MFYIDLCSNTTSIISISPNSSLLKYTSIKNETITLKFGVKSCKVKLAISDTVKDDHIRLSHNIIHDLKIPFRCLYDTLIDEDQITIGPFIGILAETSDKNLKKMLPAYKSFVKAYQHIGGAIIIFSLDSISTSSDIVSGFLYRPDQGKWEYNTFYYPASVMSILETSLTSRWEEFQEKMHHFTSVHGTKVFNYPHFSKWEMHQLLSPKLTHVLPETIIYKDVDDIKYMLQQYDSIYLKPLHGRLGMMILKVVKFEFMIEIHYVSKGRSRVKTFSNDDDIIAFFKEQLVPGLFVIQEAIPLMTYQERCIDFRVMMTRNEAGKWENLGIYSRYGAKGKIVSNITAGGYTEMFHLTLQNVWQLSETEVKTIKNKIEKMIKESLIILESHGYHFGNIGFDIGLDKDCNLYIIEINHQNPDPYIAVMANNKKMFYLARLKNMLYAKYLEGFDYESK